MRALLFLLPMLLNTSCGLNRKFPEKIPADFQIVYHLDGGMRNVNRTITLQMGECSDAGRSETDGDYNYTWNIADIQELQNLYQELRKLGAFSIRSTQRGKVYDRGGERVQYTINRKSYDVNDSQSHFISEKDGPNFNAAIELIVSFAQNHRPAITNKIASSSNADTITTEHPDIQNNSDNSMSNTKGIPAKMPGDFKIEYEMNGGFAGTYRFITLQFGSCNDRNKAVGAAETKKNWINKDLKKFEELYNQLYKLNAFTLQYTTKGQVADRGGESLKFTIDKKEYTVSDLNSDYIKSSDKQAFKNAIQLVLTYADSGK